MDLAPAKKYESVQVARGLMWLQCRTQPILADNDCDGRRNFDSAIETSTAHRVRHAGCDSTVQTRYQVRFCFYNDNEFLSSQ